MAMLVYQWRAMGALRRSVGQSDMMKSLEHPPTCLSRLFCLFSWAGILGRVYLVPGLVNKQFAIENGH